MSTTLPKSWVESVVQVWATLSIDRAILAPLGPIDAVPRQMAQEEKPIPSSGIKKDADDDG